MNGGGLQMISRSGRRNLVKERHWRAHVAAQGASGESVRVYCASAGVTESGFYWWKRELARRDNPESGVEGVETAPTRGVPAVFAEVAIGELAPSIEVVLRGDRRVRVGRGFDAETLQRVVAVLEGAAC